jgi:membrane protein DedA with SNARE-associated domain
MNETLQFVMQHGTMVLVAIVFVEQMGLPVPALPILVAFGVLAGTGHLNLWIMLVGAVSAAIGADWIWFTLGRHRGRRVLALLLPNKRCFTRKSNQSTMAAETLVSIMW